MPIYEYNCRNCAADLEFFLLSNRETIACPKCESREVARKLSVFSSPASRNSSEASGGGCGCTPQTCGCH